jgi:CheY-like chemotaxis protein
MTKTIMIVDDEPDIILSFKIVLLEYGYKVDSFTDPILALENFKAGLYDLIIIDIRMPKMCGFELYKELKKIDDKIKVCFLTAGEMYYEEFRSEKVFPALDDVQCFIRKPIENEELIRQVKKII